MICTICQDTGWVCENHPDKSWSSEQGQGCQCGGAGMPCDCQAIEPAKLEGDDVG